MSTRTRFEDRLLGELKKEIELREAGSGADTGTGTGAGAGTATASVRRRFGPRRIAVVAACAAAWAATVVVPGSPADSGAWAAERHDDGSVELTVSKQGFGIDDQLELAERVRPWGIRVDVVAPGEACSSWDIPRVMVLTAEGDPVRAWPVTLRRGSKLVIENSWGEPVTRDEIEHYRVKPCDR
ncbi:hypothetical protein [Streptomyces cahuitamycinicus]|uniref:Uncharacterized protein n=1 Tax=Streptomyces cahuitamycinicus TaxID=2070367 RepID=A0A2N8TPK9_9ACTN|nr:hypothetical protein [Streptomyces cahuitamycinicus]PNG20972.1 hypothetical protein C1J00_17340 [Streptomyces cahuitamycinicus]